MEIKILGTGCSKCTKAYELAQKVANENNVDATITKVEALKDIMGYGVMSTPAVVIDEEVVHTGSVPSSSQMKSFIVK